MPSPTPADWQTRLGLEPHPEGGWFRRVYTDENTTDTPHGPRRRASSIHYLLDRAQPVGRFHRVRAAILHFLQAGGPVEYALVGPDGTVSFATLGFGPGEALFLAAPAGAWKASRLVGAADHALVAEVVVPGFDWADHEYLTPAARAALPPEVRDALATRGWPPA